MERSSSLLGRRIVGTCHQASAVDETARTRRESMAKAMHIARDSVVATEEATANRQYQYGTTGVGMMGGCCMCSAVHP
jgi:hypothetical protein